MKGKRFKTQFDNQKVGLKGQASKGKSVTVPDQTISIKKLMQNTRNPHSLAVSNYIDGIYSGGVVPKFEDINDYHAYKKDLQQKKENLEAHLKELQDEKKKAESQENNKDKNTENTEE